MKYLNIFLLLFVVTINLYICQSKGSLSQDLGWGRKGCKFFLFKGGLFGVPQNFVKNAKLNFYHRAKLLKSESMLIYIEMKKVFEKKILNRLMGNSSYCRFLKSVQEIFEIAFSWFHNSTFLDYGFPAISQRPNDLFSFNSLLS